MQARYGLLIRWHLIFCIFYYPVQDLLNNRSWEGLQKMFEPESVLFMLSSFVIMFGYALFPYLALRKSYAKPWYELALWLFLGSLAAVGFRYFVEEVLAPVLVGFRNYPAGTSWLTYYLDNLYFLLLHGAVGVIVFLLQVTRFREQQRQELLVENQRTELAFLRSQINPHFLFNTLNNVYSLFFQKSDKALRVIERLTVMLRYGLYEKAEKVPLRKEVEHLVNFIELEKLRYDFEPQVQLSLPESMPEITVPPLILIAFVENAFKHGDLRQELKIDLLASKDFLDFKVANFIKQQQKDREGGIGLENLKKRLQLLYGEQQTITLQSDVNFFTAQLKIRFS